MSIKSFIENTAALDFAIKSCIEAGLILPALVLIYAGMDIMASLERQPSESVGPSFRAWVDRYALEGRQLPATSMDLYAARCGILHTLTTDPDPARAGKARRIV